jgi:MFS family permease
VVAGLLCSFGLFGAAFGVWQALVADVREALNLSPGALGFAISVGLVALLPAMVVAGRAADRFGRSAVVAVAGALVGVAFLGLSMVPSYGALVGTLLLFFAMTGAYDVGINAAAMGFEQRTGRRILSVAHAAFSGGAALAALAAGFLLYRGLSFHSLFVGGALFLWALLALDGRWLVKFRIIRRRPPEVLCRIEDYEPGDGGSPR